MAILYKDLLGQIAVPLTALRGGQVAAAETAYNDLTWDSARFPLPFIKDTLANAVGNFAQVIAETANHPWRAHLASATAAIAHRGAIPKEDANSKPLLGVLGAIKDSGNDTALTEKPLEYIERVVRLKAANVVTEPVYHFARVSRTLYHTCDTVVAECCVYDAAAERAKLEDQAGEMLLPDTLAAAIVAETLSMIGQRDELLAQATYFGQMAERVKAQIRQGLTSVLSELPEQGGQ